MNGYIKRSVRPVWNACSVLAIGALSAAGCAGVLATEPSVTPVQLAQVAEDACTGVPTSLRDQGLLAFRADIANAVPLSEGVAVGKMNVSRPRGEMIALRAAPNMTVPWLERVNSCHVALTAAGQLTGSVADPFVVPGTTIRVEERNAGYLVTIHATNESVAGEVVQRANTMLASPAHATTAELER